MSEVLIPSTKAEELSAALWALAMPPHLRGGGYVTSSLFGRIMDLQGKEWIVAQDDFRIKVHADAKLNGIAGILQPWIDQALLPAETNNDLAKFIESKRGEWLVVYEAFPALFKLGTPDNPTGVGRTRAQLVSEGRLNAPDIKV